MDSTAKLKNALVKELAEIEEIAKALVTTNAPRAAQLESIVHRMNFLVENCLK